VIFQTEIRGQRNKQQPNGVKTQTGEHKLRNDVNWQGALKEKRVNEMGVKQRLGCIWASCDWQNREQTFLYT
jgi:hypothetical protein